jgi:hypothetical protein
MDKTRAAKMYDLKIFPTKIIERRVSFDGYGNLKNLVTKLQDAFMELEDQAHIEAVTYDDGDMDHSLGGSMTPDDLHTIQAIQDLLALAKSIRSRNLETPEVRDALMELGTDKDLEFIMMKGAIEFYQNEALSFPDDMIEDDPMYDRDLDHGQDEDIFSIKV